MTALETKNEEIPSPLERILALDDLSLMKTCRDARYLRTIGFLCNMLAFLSLLLMAMQLCKEPPQDHPLRGTLPFLVNVVNLIFFSSFGYLFRNVRCFAVRPILKAIIIICLSLCGIGLLVALWEAVTVEPNLTSIVLFGGFLLVFFFIFRALSNQQLFGPVAVTYRQLVLIRRKRMQNDKIMVQDLPPCKTARKFDYAVIAAAWISLFLMILSTFSQAFIKVPARVPESPKIKAAAPVRTVSPANQESHR